MSLNSLSRYEQKEAKAILAATALAYDMNVQLPESIARYEREISEVLSEVRAALNLSPDDVSERANRLIESQLSVEIRRAIMGDTRISDVQNSLGDRGELPIGAYSVSFVSGFGKGGIPKENEAFVRKSVRSSDLVLHKKHPAADDLNISATLIAKVVRGTNKSRDHWLLVDAMRQERSLDVHAAWRIFPEVIPLGDVGSPLELLNSFVEHYGFELELPGFRGKLIQDLRVPHTFVPTKSNAGANPTIIHGGRKFVYIESGADVTNKGDVIGYNTPMILTGYAIDVGLYVADYNKYS